MSPLNNDSDCAAPQQQAQNCNVSQQTQTHKLTIAIIGLGLIGGSLALALKQKHSHCQILGIDQSTETLQTALERHIIDQAPPLDQAIPQADIVLICVPVGQIDRVLRSCEPSLLAHTLITDVGSTKLSVINAARDALGAKISQFIPAHPIAGSEQHGINAAQANLFEHKKTILCPLAENNPENLQKIQLLWETIGADCHLLTPEQHDAIFAAVSHLPHLLAYTYMAQIAHSDDMRLKLELAGSGFRDFTRIAGSSSAIWSDIFFNNRSALLRELDTWQLLLANVKSMLEHQQTDTLRHVLDEAAALRQTWQKLDTADTTDTKLLQQDMPSLPQRSAQQSTCATTAHGKPSAATAIAVGTVAHKLDRSTIKMPSLQQVKGNITLPGSKSISNRVLLLAALSKGTTLVRSVLQAEDTHVMLTALKQLGVEYIRQGDSNDYLIQGTAGRFPNQQARLFMGNAGTAIRPLTAVLAIQGGAYELSGVARMHERPINDLVEGLRQLGCNIDYLQQTGYPPIKIGMRHPSSIPHTIQINGNTSSQFTTALLMALPLLSAHLQHAITVEIMGELISKPYIALTLNLLERFGVEVIQQGWSSFTIPAQASYASPGDITVEGDASSASYFLAAGAIGQGPVRVNGIGTDSIQGDVQFAQALQQMGAQISMDNLSITASGPTVGKLRAIDLDCNAIPDAAMTLAMCALFAEGTTTLRNIASWRIKETDRIHAMATELGKLGALIESGPDFIRITPPQIWRTPIQGIDTYDDHRIAMCFSLAAFAPVPITINHPECVTKTFPDYFATFASLY